MRIVVSDTSCMIDLRKGGLLEAMLQLPYSFVMPDTLFENEWLGLSANEKRTLLNLGLEVHTLPEPLVQHAARYFNNKTLFSKKNSHFSNMFIYCTWVS